MDKAAQQKMMEYQMLDRRIKQLQQQMEIADSQLMEIMATLQSLDEFSGMKEGSDILFPLNNGIFAKGKLGKSDKLFVNVGSQVVVDKSIPETKEIIGKHRDEIDGLRQTIADAIDEMIKKAATLEKELKDHV